MSSVKVKKSKDAKIQSPVSTSSTGLPKWKQSPIDLRRENTWPRKYTPLLLNGHWLDEGQATMTNTGRTVQIELSGRRQPSLTCGPLRDFYEFRHLQFRWGTNNSRGAEHSVDGKWYSMEAQLIHWNTSYGTIERCYEKPDGFAILSFLFQVVGCPGMIDNPDWTHVTDCLGKIAKAKSSIDISTECMGWILKACAGTGYYSYCGSLTTAPYQECAIWLVIPKPITISANQVEAFRSLYDEKGEYILMNRRSEQKLHGRRIFYADENAIV